MALSSTATGKDGADAFAWALINAAPDGVLVVEEGGVVVLANRRAEELLGYDRGELLRLTVEDLLPFELRAGHQQHRASYAAAPYSRAMGDGQKLVARRRDGSPMFVEISLSPMYEASSRLVIATIRPPRDTTRHDRELQVTEQERIGEAVTQTTIQRLQAITMTLSAARSGNACELPQRCDDVVVMLDDLIGEIRGLVFEH
jgi:PAS domain S-box-containing protein